LEQGETKMALTQPLEIALIGAGNRSQKIYAPLFEFLKPWVRLVAVCDPVKENADAFADRLDVQAFYSLPELVRAQLIEAALVVAPIDVHHASSCYLSQHGIHHHVETSMSSLLLQAQEMVQMARENNVVLRIAENFFRFPFDRIAKEIDKTGFLGSIKRITSLHDHTGYHNNSRWIHFYGAYPEAAQAVKHTMPTAPHYESPHRFHTDETFRAHFFFFPDNRLVTDLAGNIKGMLGRYPRPGYTELNGARGVIVRYATHNWHGEAEVRYCSDEALQNGAIADQIFPIQHLATNGCWVADQVDLPIGRVEYVNPYRPEQTPAMHATRDYYAAAIMDHIVDFARAVRGEAQSEYTDEDAMMAMMMEAATRESALRNGERLSLPLTGELESEQQMRQALKQKHGVDPLDVEGMLAVAVPRP
jgi:predicted dehydrogenase